MIDLAQPAAAPAPGPANELQAELRALYQELDQAVSRLGPVCALSGRCCRFDEYGHTLFASAVEAELLVDLAPAPKRPLDGGQTCPWQDERGHCAAREARPLGCRVYYCDPAYQPAAGLLSELFISRLKQLADRHDRPWNYAPLHQHLEDARVDGRLVIDLARSTLDTNPSHQYT
jgi:Fe-S-cluster containining protein